MVSDLNSRVWLGIGSYIAASLVLIYCLLLPMSTRPAVWAGPDWLLLLAIVFVVRRPNYAPVMVIAAVFLVADMVLLRPPGLWAVLVVGLTELLRKRAPGFRSMPFGVEWSTVAGMILMLALLYRLCLMVMLVPLPPLGLTAMQAGATALAYPVATVFARFAFGLRRTAVGELDAKGQRL